MIEMEYTHGVNTPVLRKYLEHITAHRTEWKQNSWAHDWDIFNSQYRQLLSTEELARFDAQATCGTAYCLAGHVVVGEGYDLNFGTGLGMEWAASETVDGTSIPVLAARILGIYYDPGSGILLDENGRDHLFSGGNSLLDLWTIANRLTQGEIEIPPNLLAVV